MSHIRIRLQQSEKSSFLHIYMFVYIIDYLYFVKCIQVSFMIVDEMHHKHPRLVKDLYWDELEPQLPYTKSSFMLRTQPHLGSAVNLE